MTFCNQRPNGLSPRRRECRQSRRWAPMLALAAVAAALGATPDSAQAAFVTPGNWSRGAAYSTAYAWDAFSSANNPNAPDARQLPAGPTFTGSVAPTLTNATSAILTGGFDIYSPTGPLSIDVAVPDYNLGSSYVTTVLFQTRTRGTEGDWSNLRLTYTDSTGSHTIAPFASAEQSRIALGGFGGDEIDYASVFHLPYNPGSLTLEMEAVGPHMSLAMASVDAIVTRGTPSAGLLSNMDSTVGYVPQPIPEPASIGLIGVAACGLLARRRK